MWLLSYWLLPIFSACVWLGMLLGLFIDWERNGHPHFPSMEAGQTIAYISDTGAYKLKPLFIAGGVVSMVALDLAILATRWLRHTGRLAQNTSRTQAILSWLGFVFAVIGTLGLILLSCFDTYHYPRRHDGFLLIFIVGWIVSAILLVAENQRLGIHYRQHRIIRISFWVKLVFAVTEVILAIVFAATTFTHVRNVAAVVEWVIALIFTLWILSFSLDLAPGVRTKHHIPQGEKDLEPGMNGSHHHDQRPFHSQGNHHTRTRNFF